MKKIFLAILLLPALCMAQTAKGYTVKGNIKGLNAQVSLVAAVENKTAATDNAVNGTFVLKGQMTDPDLYQIIIPGSKAPIDLFMGNDAVTITGDMADMNTIKVSGSVFNDEYTAFKQEFYPYFEKLNGIGNSLNTEKDPSKRQSMIQEYTGMRNRILEATAKFVGEKSGSPVSSLLLLSVMRLYESPTELEERFTQLQPSARKGAIARQLEKTISDAKIGAVGTMAMDFTQKDVNGKPITLSSFKGKYVLVDFWASWCRPCRAENPNVVNAYQTYKDKNFTVLGVSLDQQKPNWLDAIKADNLTWTHVSDLQYWNNAVAQLYHIQSIPANMLIDPNGKIIAKDLRGEALNQKLKELLK